MFKLFTIDRVFISRFWAQVRPHRGWAITLALLSTATSLTGLLPPLISRHVVDDIIFGHLAPDARVKQMWLITFASLALYLSITALDLFQSHRMHILHAKMGLSMRHRMFRHILRLPFPNIWSIKAGGLTSRLFSDTDKVATFLEHSLIAPMSCILRIIGAACIVFTINWKLAIGCLAVIPPIAIISLVFARHVRPIYRALQQKRQELSAATTDTFHSLRAVRINRAERKHMLQFARRDHDVVRKGLHAAGINLLSTGTGRLIVSFSSLTIVLWGATLVIHEEATIGDMMAFQMYAMMVIGPVFQLSQSVAEAQQSLVAIQRAFDTLALPPDKPDRPDAVPAPRAIERVAFNDVAFAYAEGRPALRSIDLDVRGHQVVALVGPSGAGKSTFIDLLVRNFDPTTGQVSVNGQDIRSFQLDTYRQLFGVVDQDPSLFDGTIRDNIACARHLDDEAVIQAARLANIHDFIRQLPEGYDTAVGERGVKLSGGQRQRICIARAFYANPQILILDEATSSLDSETEARIQESLRLLMSERTTFIVAHRLATVQQANVILVLDQGEIKESGRHDELMAKRGLYYHMVERQRLFGDERRRNAPPAGLPRPARVRNAGLPAAV